MDKFTKYVVIVLCLVVVVGVFYSIVQKNAYEKQITELQQKLASSAETIKIQEGQYQKLVETQKNLEDAIDKSTEQGRALAARLDKVDAKLLSVANTQVSIRDEVIKVKDIVNKTNPGGKPGSWQIPIEKKQGLLGTSGFCATGPTKDDLSNCELRLYVEPWVLSQTLSQQDDGSWKIDAAVPPEVSVKFGRVAVNPKLLKPVWYERLNTTIVIAGNKSDGLGGLGIGYKISNVNVSGLVLATSAGTEHVYYGAGITWYPWEK